MKRQPLATIQGARVGDATPGRGLTPGADSASRAPNSLSPMVVTVNPALRQPSACSAGAHRRLMPAASTAGRVSMPWVQYRQGTAAMMNRIAVVMSDRQLLQLDLRQVVDAKAERRGILHVPGLTNDDVDVRIGVACAPVVNFQRRGIAIPDRDRAVRLSLVVDDVEQQPIDRDRIGAEQDLLRIEDVLGRPRERTAVPDAANPIHDLQNGSRSNRLYRGQCSDDR